MRVLKLILIALLLLGFTPILKVDALEVKITPNAKITSSNLLLKYGDRVEFLVVKDVEKNGVKYINKGTLVEGSILLLTDNDWYLEPAKINIEDFYTKNVNGQRIKLEGIIIKTGNPHLYWADTVGGFMLIRGGEVQIKPKKDTFTLFLKD